MSARRLGSVALLLALAAPSAALLAGDATPPRAKPYRAELPEGAGRDFAARSCLMCHAATLITQQAKDSTGWTKTVTQMEKWGVTLTPGERDTLIAYLAEKLGPRR